MFAQSRGASGEVQAGRPVLGSQVQSRGKEGLRASASLPVHLVPSFSPGTPRPGASPELWLHGVGGHCRVGGRRLLSPAVPPGGTLSPWQAPLAEGAALPPGSAGMGAGGQGEWL